MLYPLPAIRPLIERLRRGVNVYLLPPEDGDPRDARIAVWEVDGEPRGMLVTARESRRLQLLGCPDVGSRRRR